jgi:hypothetical protein
VYKLDSFVGFIGDEHVHAQECYVFFSLAYRKAAHGIAHSHYWCSKFPSQILLYNLINFAVVFCGPIECQLGILRCLHS